MINFPWLFLSLPLPLLLFPSPSLPPFLSPSFFFSPLLSLALHRGPPGSKGPMIPPLLTLPPPPWNRGLILGVLGPRSSPYGHGWWGVNAEHPFPGPGYGGPSRGGFHKEQRHPRRLKSWSLVKNTYPPKDGPQVMEGEVHFFMLVYPQSWSDHDSSLSCPLSF